MLTNINISNEIATLSAAVDVHSETRDNLVIAGGTVAGSLAVNGGGTIHTIDGFAAQGTVALETETDRIYVADGSYLTFARDNVGVMLRSLGDTSGELKSTSAGLTFTPDEGSGAIGIAVARDDATLNLALNGTGTATLGGGLDNPVMIIPKNFSLGFAATTSTGALMSGTVYGDGVNDVYAALVDNTQVQLSGNGSVGANLKLGDYELNNVTMSGTILLDPLNSAIIFAQGSTFGLDIGTRHISFETTDTAGGQLTFGANGVTFTTAGGDGGLAISATEDGETVSAVLNVTGTVTYSLDGSITLGAGTVVQNRFADGDVLTFTAGAEAGGTIVFDENGLSVTSAKPGSVGITLETEGVETLGFTSIDGTLTYNNDTVTISDGTVVNITDATNGTYNGYFTVSGGTASARYTAAGDFYTVSDGATFAVHMTWNGEEVNLELKGGTIIDVYANGERSMAEVLTAGTILNFDNDDIVFTLQTAGTYTLNGHSVTTTADGVQVLLSDYDTVIPVDIFASNIAVSADLAYDFLPDYSKDYENALALTDAISFDAIGTQLTDLLPAETARLGEIDFGTQADELTAQIVIAPEK